MNAKGILTDTLKAKENFSRTFELGRLSSACLGNEAGKISLNSNNAKKYLIDDSMKPYTTNEINFLIDDKNGVAIDLECGREHMQESSVKANGFRELVVNNQSINLDIKAMYEHEGDWEDESDDDEDWDPNQDSELVSVQWFCTNCTCSNSEERIRCQLCEEHRESGILKRGHLAPREKDDGTEIEKRTYTDPDTTSTAIGFDERMLLHFEVTTKPNPHPERPDRLRAIMRGLDAGGLYPGRCCKIPAREATREEMEMVHTHDHIDAVESTSAYEASLFTADTYANCHSALAARLATGLCIDLANAILNGKICNGFALVRPPGHHALDSTVMGFCLHNNAAVAAKSALAAGAKKVLILDWDVHHGNGTQEIFYRDSSVLYISLHRYEAGRFYPGTGGATEIGIDGGAGFSVNIPWPCGGIGDEDYIFAFQHIVIPIAKQYAPELIIISAGFDAAEGDPLGGCKVSPQGYALMTQMLYSLVEGRLLVVLEGGYNLRSISASSSAVLQVLLGESPCPLPMMCEPSIPGLATVMEVCDIQRQYWKIDPLSIMTMRSQFKSRVKGRRARKRDVRGPIWWKWGRKRVVYDHWFSASRSR